MATKTKVKAARAHTRARAKTAARKTTAKPDSASGEVWRMKIKLVRGIGARGAWEARLDVRPSTTLVALHGRIQDLVGFKNDHLWTFFVATSDTSRDRITLEDEFQEPRLEMPLTEIFPLPKDQQLFYWFDFGDDWHFSIARTAQAPAPGVKGAKYPHLVATKGKTPVQYPE
jgi:hypothetical protein